VKGTETQLGAVLRRADEWTQIDPTEEYQLITVRMHGRGVVGRTRVKGLELAGQRRRVVRSGQLLVARIDARNGAIGLVPDDLDGGVVTSDFLSWEIDQSRLIPAYLEWLTRSRTFVADCTFASEGTTNRVRLSEARFRQIRLWLPPLEEQRKIASGLDHLAARIAKVQSLVIQTRRLEGRAERESLSARQLATTESVLGDLVTVQSGYAFRSADMAQEGIRLVRNVNVGHGHLRWDSTAYLPTSMAPIYRRFELSEGDILVSLDRPLVSTGLKVAQVSVSDLPALLVQRVGRFVIESNSLTYGPCFGRE
jgi:hypothetical protein